MMRTSALLGLVALALAPFAVGQDAEKAARVDFEKQIRPFLRDHCVKCHGSDKQKGDLRLDLRRYVFTGKDDPIVPGDAEGSLLIELVSLPADDPDVMPNEGETLTAEQIALLSQWISEGADWPEAGDIAIATREATRKAREVIELPPLDEAQSAAETAALEALRASGALAHRIAANTIALEVNFSLRGPKVDDAALDLLAGLEPTLVWLNLSRTAVTEAGLARLTRFKNLRRLNLANTTIGDGALAHVSALTGLEYLNLYGTKVGDAGLGHLAGLTHLEKLFLWQSAVTEAGASELAAKLPGTRIDLGREAERMLAAIAEPEEVATAINMKCPVTGKDIDAAFTSELDGKLIAFCCGKCKAKFDADPDSFRAKLGLEQAVVAINMKCPVTGKDIDPAFTSELDGKRVAFCCGKCKAKFDADPDAFRTKLGLEKKD